MKEWKVKKEKKRDGGGKLSFVWGLEKQRMSGKI